MRDSHRGPLQGTGDGARHATVRAEVRALDRGHERERQGFLAFHAKCVSPLWTRVPIRHQLGVRRLCTGRHRIGDRLQCPNGHRECHQCRRRECFVFGDVSSPVKARRHAARAGIELCSRTAAPGEFKRHAIVVIVSKHLETATLVAIRVAGTRAHRVPMSTCDDGGVARGGGWSRCLSPVASVRRLAGSNPGRG